MVLFNNKYSRLAALYLSGNCSEAQKESFEQWLALSKANQEQFNQFKKAWELSAAAELKTQIDTEKALARVRAKISGIEANQRISKAPKMHTLKLAWRYAGSAAAIFLIGFLMYYFTKTEPKAETITYAAQNNQHNAYRFADGTDVFLKDGSLLHFQNDFGQQNERAISFEGEAFFEVAHDAEKPFLINIANLQIEVLGTSFNLKAVAGAPTYTCDLITGRVKFALLDQTNGHVLEQIVLMPGQRGVYDIKNQQISRVESPQHAISWKTGVLAFNNAPLVDVMRALEETFGLSVDLDPKLDNLKLTARFENEKPEKILEAIRVIFDLRIIQTNSKIQIR